MSTKDKLINRFRTIPSDFTWDELVRVFAIYGYHPDNKGKTSGSRVVFCKEGMSSFQVHKPHPTNVIKKSILRAADIFLKKLT